MHFGKGWSWVTRDHVTWAFCQNFGAAFVNISIGSHLEPATLELFIRFPRGILSSLYQKPCIKTERLFDGSPLQTVTRSRGELCPTPRNSPWFLIWWAERGRRARFGLKTINKEVRSREIAPWLASCCRERFIKCVTSTESRRKRACCLQR